MNQIPPFNPGDKVVRIGPDDPDWYYGFGVKHGHTYVIDTVFLCCSSYGCRVTLIGRSIPEWYCCDNCNKTHTGWLAKDFRKLDDISTGIEGLLEELSEEMEVRKIVQKHAEGARRQYEKATNFARRSGKFPGR